jgi:hypothetical protein
MRTKGRSRKSRCTWNRHSSIICLCLNLNPHRDIATASTISRTGAQRRAWTSLHPRHCWPMRNVDMYRASTIFTNTVMISSWYAHVYNKQVYSKLIKKQIKRWAESDSCKQAETFSLADVKRFLEDGPNNEYWLLRKAVLIYRINGLCRKQELVTSMTSYVDMGTDLLRGRVKRVKAHGVHQNALHHFIISDPLCVRIQAVSGYVQRDRPGGHGLPIVQKDL